MSRYWKVAAVLFVGLPLWFIAWRSYEDWRVRAAYRSYLDNYIRVMDGPGNPNEKEKEMDALWESRSVDFRAHGHRHPREWHGKLY